jgi:hypothetical protein
LRALATSPAALAWTCASGVLVGRLRTVAVERAVAAVLHPVDGEHLEHEEIAGIGDLYHPKHEILLSVNRVLVTRCRVDPSMWQHVRHAHRRIKTHDAV